MKGCLVVLLVSQTKIKGIKEIKIELVSTGNEKEKLKLGDL